MTDTILDTAPPYAVACSTVSTEANKTGTWRSMRPFYEEKTAPCSAACPAAEDIPRIEMLANQGRFREAWETIMAENPFPAVCGQVCFHPCQAACNRGGYDAPVAINHLERFLGEYALSQKWPLLSLPGPTRAKRVAIAGGGPAGLSAAWFLRRLGYHCEVFEAETAPGGLLRWGIPAYRLEPGILRREIARIEAAGVRIHCNRSLEADFLKRAPEKYDAVFVGCGLNRPVALKIPGEESATEGLAFLKKQRHKKPEKIIGPMAVIGGGNTAVDVARALVRLGGKPVIIYRRRQGDMPAFAHEVQGALAEGVVLRELLAPIAIEKRNRDYLLHLEGMKTGRRDKSGRPRPIPDPDRKETLKVNRVFTALGAECGPGWHNPKSKKTRCIDLSHCSVRAGDIPVLFGGDLTNRSKSVADAILSGKQAAVALDTYFRKGWEAISGEIARSTVGRGPGLSLEIYNGGLRTERSRETVDLDAINLGYFRTSTGIEPATLSPAQRIKSFKKAETVFNEAEAVAAAGRCFNCGICNACDNCRLFCPEMAVLGDKPRYINLDYCKGCGMCVTECPRNAMNFKEEPV